MPTVQERVTKLEQQTEKMDMDLKAFFVEQQTFISEALAGVESRLGARLGGRIDGVETRLGTRIDSVDTRLTALNGRVDKMDRDVNAAFTVVDARLGGIDRRLQGIDGRLSRIDGKLDTLIRRGTRGGRPARTRRKT